MCERFASKELIEATSKLYKTSMPLKPKGLENEFDISSCIGDNCKIDIEKIIEVAKSNPISSKLLTDSYFNLNYFRNDTKLLDLFFFNDKINIEEKKFIIDEFSIRPTIPFYEMIDENASLKEVKELIRLSPVEDIYEFYLKFSSNEEIFNFIKSYNPEFTKIIEEFKGLELDDKKAFYDFLFKKGYFPVVYSAPRQLADEEVNKLMDLGLYDELSLLRKERTPHYEFLGGSSYLTDSFEKGYFFDKFNINKDSKLIYENLKNLVWTCNATTKQAGCIKSINKFLWENSGLFRRNASKCGDEYSFPYNEKLNYYKMNFNIKVFDQLKNVIKFELESQYPPEKISQIKEKIDTDFSSLSDEEKALFANFLQSIHDSTNFGINSPYILDEIYKVSYENVINAILAKGYSLEDYKKLISQSLSNNEER